MKRRCFVCGKEFNEGENRVMLIDRETGEEKFVGSFAKNEFEIYYLCHEHMRMALLVLSVGTDFPYRVGEEFSDKVSDNND